MVALVPRSLLAPAHPAGTWRAQWLVKLLRASARHTAGELAPADARARLERLSLLAPTPAGVRRRRAELAGMKARVFRPRGVDESRVVLHLHGGGYALCSGRTHKGILGDLALATRHEVWAVDYALAPEHPFPRPIEDGVRAFEALVARGVAPERIVLSGDSAGGALAVSVALSLRDMGRPMPGALVLLSPWVDLGVTGVDRGEDYLVPDLMARFAEHYLQGTCPTNPLASPARADLSGLPPMLVQAGGVEVLRGQIEDFARNARSAGTDVRLEVWDNMFHAFHGFPFVVPEAREAFASIGRWTRARRSW
ncbi:MAG: alpha/beta hydrolase [Deltaproteobacteria bacterium]|nr:alpha/beta hydrolase [Deltaproteobacteria bacterium]